MAKSTKTTKHSYAFTSKLTEASWGYSTHAFEIMEGGWKSVADTVMEESRWLSDGQESTYIDELKMLYNAGVREIFENYDGHLGATFTYATDARDEQGNQRYGSPAYELGITPLAITKAYKMFSKCETKASIEAYEPGPRSPGELVAKFKGAREVVRPDGLRIAGYLPADTASWVLERITDAIEKRRAAYYEAKAAEAAKADEPIAAE